MRLKGQLQEPALKRFALAIAAASTLTGACAVSSEKQPVSNLPAVAMVQVRGTAVYRERIALLPGSVMTVRVEDVARADAPSVVLAESKFDLTGQQVPLPFAIEVKRADIVNTAATNLRIQIHAADGRLQWTTDTRYPVAINSGPLGADMGAISLVRVSG